ncbi:SDR family oxidoreductase [Solimonas sp. SE-A11]|uniref:SDR family oxidoreductase n=1 Tax=Solimonas sp. SE-A11 TaxID=3054954 RepID=UPI00259CE94D|nr:SDR family oxidoreductase [Solimonas sp. SE-A11]MDM4770721.1 SDR family oxidoreductase [Solimonas sp. SE-A11]
MQDKVCLVTGATSGIGRATAKALAAQGAEVFLLVRSRDKGEIALQELAHETRNSRLHLLIGDLARQSDIRRVAAEFLSTGKPLHVLVNNAGLINTRLRHTPDGIEEMFAVNHLGYFLLTELLRQRLIQSAPSRIVSVSSGAHAFVKGLQLDDLEFQRNGFSTFAVYGHSKLCNLLWTRELARQLQGSGVTANCLHPGAVGTGLGNQNARWARYVTRLLRPFFRTPERGASSSIHLATSPEVEGVSGKYYYDCKPIRPKPWAEDDAAARELWQLSQRMTRLP